MFSSIGNQIPPFNRPNAPYTQGGREYLVEIAPNLATDFFNWLIDQVEPVGIQQSVDWCLNWHTAHGLKRFKFVLTAWVMDVAEYYPRLVDANSNCYHGANATAALDLVFKPRKRMGKQEFYDTGTRMFCDLFGTRPMDVEDAAPGCDLIRYCEQYINPKGYEHVDRSKTFNISHIKHPTGRQPWLGLTKEAA